MELEKQKKIIFACFTLAGLLFIVFLGKYIVTPKELAILDEPLITEAEIFDLDPVLGDKKSKITIIEFADFGCVYCKNSAQILKKALEIYAGKIKIVWKDIPVSTVPTDSKIAHVAAHCAGKQKKFWEYHDVLFDRQDEWIKKQNFTELAQGIPEINIKKFEECLNNNSEIIEHIRANVDMAARAGVDNIPFFIINNSTRIAGVPALSTLKKEIESFLK